MTDKPSQPTNVGSNDQLGPLLEPEYPAGAEGMLGEDCWTRAQVISMLRSEKKCGWDDCMSAWADHMKRMVYALEKPLPSGYANHAHHIQRNVKEALESAPKDTPKWRDGVR